MTWGAFEVLCRDVFIACGNADPARTLAELKARSQGLLSKQVSIDQLATWDFNLSTGFGSFLAQSIDFSNYALGRDAITALLHNAPEVTSGFKHPDLWSLCQRRHLIVHRRGIVDSKYVDATGDSARIGTALTIKPSDFSSYHSTVHALGLRILLAADRWHLEKQSQGGASNGGT